MTPTDCGPLVALLDKHDKHHLRCVEAAKHLGKDGFATTWPCLTEAMYLLYEAGGYRLQEQLWTLCHTKALRLYLPDDDDAARMAVLMAKYSDAPMDLADASLVVAAERTGIRRIFTLDRHFYAYRTESGEPFEVLPVRDKP